jgi:uncharacterized protein YndB with AHSA1/START domain
MNLEINHTFLFDQPPEKVWEYLTQPGLIQLWLMKNDFKPIVGHDFQFISSPAPQIGFDGIAYCKVLEIIEYKKLAYSWRSGPGNGTIELDSRVEWTLIAKPNGTELQLKQSGFTAANFSIFNAMNDGWMKNVKKIITQLNANRP